VWAERKTLWGVTLGGIYSNYEALIGKIAVLIFILTDLWRTQNAQFLVM
jgi:hypothetical protein